MVNELRELVDLVNEHGGNLELLDADEARAEVNSPTYLGAITRATAGDPTPNGSWSMPECWVYVSA